MILYKWRLINHVRDHNSRDVESFGRLQVQKILQKKYIWNKILFHCTKTPMKANSLHVHQSISIIVNIEMTLVQF